MKSVHGLTRVVFGAITAGVLLCCSAAIFVPAIAQQPSHVPLTKKHIYFAEADPAADIAAAEKQAKAEHKRIIIDFGGDWCPDCQVLDVYFHESPNAELMAKHFVLVHVDIGHMDKNLDVVTKYGIPKLKGVPSLSVIDAQGKVLYAQGAGEFSDMRHLESSALTEFLNKWKG